MYAMPSTYERDYARRSGAMMERVPVEIEELASGALAGAVASSILGPLIAQRRERRDLRAAVLRCVAEVERTRWTPADRQAFREAVIACRASALVAGINRDLTDRYLFFAEVGRRSSEWAEEVQPEPEGGGSIPSDLAKLIRQAATLLVNHLWHPYRTRLRVRWQLRRLARSREEVEAAHADDHGRVRWTPSVLV